MLISILTNKKVLFLKKILSVPFTIDSSFFSPQIAPWSPNFPHQRLWFPLKWVIGFPNTLYLAKFAFQTFSIWGSVNLKGSKPGMYIITLQLKFVHKSRRREKITNNPNFHQNTLDLNGNSTYLFYIILAPLPPSFVKWNWAFMKNQKLN